MATQTHNRKGFFPLNPKARVNYYPVKTTQTFYRGDALILSSGQLQLAVYTDTEWIGVAAQDSVAQTAGTLVAVFDDPDELFVGRMDGATSYVVGGDLDMANAAAGAHELDANASTYNVLKLLYPLEPTLESAAAGQQWVFRINLHALADTST